MERYYHTLLGRLRFDRPFRDALVAYQGVFQELLSEMHATTIPHAKRLAIKFWWNPNMNEFDAVAKRALSQRSIILHVACWSDLQGMANLIFRSRDLAQSIGNPSLELKSFAQWFEANEAHTESDAPQCPIRKEAACIASELGLTLIMLHEIGHHALGHLDRGRRLGFVRQSESLANPKRRTAEKVALVQASELEADRFAFSYMASLTARTESTFSTQIISDSQLRSNLFEIGTIAFTMITYFLGGYERPLDFYDTRGHPHPLVRLIAGLEAMHRAVSDIDAARAEAAVKASLEFLGYSQAATNVLEILSEHKEGVVQRIAALEEKLSEPRQWSVFSFSRGEWSA